MRSWTDSRLLDATRRGEAEAFGEFFHRHGDLVLLYLSRRTPDAELAADLTSEAFVSALTAVHLGDADDVRNGAAWMLTIARHKLIDAHRRGLASDSARRRLSLERPALEDADIVRIDEMACDPAHLEAALARLAPDERELIVERFLRERPYRELARREDQPEVVIRKRVSRGLRRLRQALGVEVP